MSRWIPCQKCTRRSLSGICSACRTLGIRSRVKRAPEKPYQARQKKMSYSTHLLKQAEPIAGIGDSLKALDARLASL
jgi:hypothetical protein